MKIQVSKLKPLAGYVLVEPAEKDTITSSGIVLPVSDTEKPQYGKILAIGENSAPKKTCDHDCDCKSAKELGLKVGDAVIYKKWGGNDVKIDDIEYQFLKLEDILAKIEK
jgi:chaperonin GroES